MRQGLPLQLGAANRLSELVTAMAGPRVGLSRAVKWTERSFVGCGQWELCRLSVQRQPGHSLSRGQSSIAGIPEALGRQTSLTGAVRATTADERSWRGGSFHTHIL